MSKPTSTVCFRVANILRHSHNTFPGLATLLINLRPATLTPTSYRFQLTNDRFMYLAAVRF